MKSGRVTRGLALLIALAVVVLVLVSVETGSATKQTRGHSVGLPAGLTATPPLAPGLPPRADAHEGSHAGTQADTRARPGTEPLGPNPYNFRLGLINGTVVKPDARNWAARTVSGGPLLLFLPATGHVPDDYRRFLMVAAASGYHVLGLDFWNEGKAVANICGVDAECYTMVQRNRFNGHGPNRFSKVDAANSVVQRLESALAYLSTHDKGGGWGRYLDGRHIRWTRIVVSGHSQGGGEASYIAHRTRVKGQLTFASPIITDADTSASWLKTPSATPSSVMYGFDASGDRFAERIAQSWRELHLGGRVLSARAPVPVTAATHRLITTMDLGDPRLAHLRVVTDGTPLDADGTPVFAKTWQWMLDRLYVDPDSPVKAATDK